MGLKLDTRFNTRRGLRACDCDSQERWQARCQRLSYFNAICFRKSFGKRTAWDRPDQKIFARSMFAHSVSYTNDI